MAELALDFRPPRAYSHFPMYLAYLRSDMMRYRFLATDTTKAKRVARAQNT
jgi:hypothetical protein